MNYLAVILTTVVIFVTSPVVYAATMVTYSYDALGRLTGVQYNGGEMSSSTAYSYDSLGNIMEMTVNASAPRGDVNFDGLVDLADAILALQVLSGHNTPEMNMAADINDDGRIGMSEAIYTIMQTTSQ